jgi:hypothetical protein
VLFPAASDGLSNVAKLTDLVTMTSAAVIRVSYYILPLLHGFVVAS